MEPSKNISSEDLKLLYTLSKIILKLQNSQPLSTCREELQINGYLPDVDADEASMFELGNQQHIEDTFEYYQQRFVPGSFSLFSIHQPLELLVNTVTNLSLPMAKIKSCSGRASTSSGRNGNSGRTGSFGTAPSRAPASIGGRASTSTDEKQAKKSGVSFFHRKNDGLYGRNSAFESSSGSDDTSSSTAGDETDDESLQHINRQNRSQNIKKMQPITYRNSQGRKHAVRNGSLPNRPFQKDITSRTSGSKNSSKNSSTSNLIVSQTKASSTSTINIQRKSTPIFPSGQTSTTVMRKSSAIQGSSKTAGRKNVQKGQTVEKASKNNEKHAGNDELQNENVQQGREKEKAPLTRTTIDQISTPSTCEPHNYTSVEGTKECQEALTLSKTTGREKMQQSSTATRTINLNSNENNKEHSHGNQNGETNLHSCQTNKNISNHNLSRVVTATTTSEEEIMNNFVNPSLNTSLSNQQRIMPSSSIPLATSEDIQNRYENIQEVIVQQQYNPPTEAIMHTTPPFEKSNSRFHSNENILLGGHPNKYVNTVSSQLEQRHHSKIQNNVQPQQPQHHQQQQYLQQSHTPVFQQQQHHYESPPQHLSQPTSHDNRGYPQQLQRQQTMIQTPPNIQQQISPQQQRLQSSQMHSQISYGSISNSAPQVPMNHYSPEFYVPPFQPMPSDLSQHTSPMVASTSLNHQSPQTFDQRSPQTFYPQPRPSQRGSNPSASMQHHLQHSQYTSPPEVSNFLNSPVTPLSNPHPSPLPPPPYPMNNGQTNFSNGAFSSNANSAVIHDQRFIQQRTWEQQQFMTQQIAWHPSQQFRSPQYPQVDPISRGPGMYSIPPENYGYPQPSAIRTTPETPKKTPRKKKTPPKDSALNRLLSTPARMPMMQSQVQPIRPQMFQQLRQPTPQQIYPQGILITNQHQRFPPINSQMNQLGPNNAQQQYYLVQGNLQSNMQIPNQQQQIIINNQQPHLPGMQAQHHQYSHPAALPQHIQFQQLSLSSPQQTQQPMSQPERMESFITSPQQMQQLSQIPQQQQQQQQQQHSQIYLQQNNQRAASLSQLHLQQPMSVPLQSTQNIHQRYSCGPDSYPNNTVQINSPYSNNSIPNAATPSFSHSVSAGFHSSSEVVPLNESHGNVTFSPSNPQLPNRLSSFNTTLLSNPVERSSPFTSPSNVAIMTPSPPKTPQGKRRYSQKSNDDNGDIYKKKKESLLSENLATTSTDVSPVNQAIPTPASGIQSRITLPPITEFQLRSQSSSSYVSSTINKSSLSYATSFSQQMNPQIKAIHGLQEHSSPFAEANNFYNCPTFDVSRAKEPFNNGETRTQSSVDVQNSNTDNLNLSTSTASNISVNVEKPITTTAEEIIISLQNFEAEEVDPCEEFLDPEVIHGTSQGVSFSNTVQNTEKLNSGVELAEVIDESTHIAQEENFETTAIIKEPSKEVIEHPLIHESVIETYVPIPLEPSNAEDLEEESVITDNADKDLHIIQDDSLERIASCEETTETFTKNADSIPIIQQEVEKEVETSLNINIAKDLEEGEILDSFERDAQPDEEMQEVNYEMNNLNDRIGKRPWEFETDEPPAVEIKRMKLTSESLITDSLNITENKPRQDSEIMREKSIPPHEPLEHLEVNLNFEQVINETSEESRGLVDAETGDDEYLLEPSPIDNTNATNFEHQVDRSNEIKALEPESEIEIHLKIRNVEDIDKESSSAATSNASSSAIPDVEDIKENESSVEFDANVSEKNRNIENGEILDEEALLADSPVHKSVNNGTHDSNKSDNSVKLNVKIIDRNNEAEDIIENELFESTSHIDASINSNTKDGNEIEVSVKFNVDNIERNIEEDKIVDEVVNEDSLLIASIHIDQHVTPGAENREEASVEPDGEDNKSNKSLEEGEIVDEETELTASPRINSSVTPDNKNGNPAEACVEFNAEMVESNIEEDKNVNEEHLLNLSPNVHTSIISNTEDRDEIDALSQITNVGEEDLLSAVSPSFITPESLNVQDDMPNSPDGRHNNETESSVEQAGEIEEPNVIRGDESGSDDALLADTPLSPGTEKLIKTDGSAESNPEAIQLNSDIEDGEITDEELLLAETPADEPSETIPFINEEDSFANADITHVDERMNDLTLRENNNDMNDVEMMDLQDNADSDIPPSYQEMVEKLGVEISIGNDEILSKMGAEAAIESAKTIVTLNVIRDEVREIVSDLSAATSLEQTIMVNLVNETVDTQLDEMKQKYLALLQLIEKNLAKFSKNLKLDEGSRFEGTFFEVLVPLYTKAIKWEQEKNESPQFYQNTKYIRKLLLSIVANFGTNESGNIWHEIFTMQIFSTPTRLNIFRKLLSKSINICTFMNEYFSLVNDLFNVTQLAAILFIKDYDAFKMSDPMLANVISGAARRVRELTPELRSRIIFQFQHRIHQFLQKFENSNLLPEAQSFISTLSWDMKAFCDSHELSTGYLPITTELHPVVDTVFKNTLKRLHQSGKLKIKGWSYNLTKSVLQSSFMSTIIAKTNHLDVKDQEALFTEIVPTLLKLVLTVPHLFVAGDPHHKLELVPTIFEDASPILNQASENNLEHMVVPFMPFATIMSAIKKHKSESTESLLKSCQNLYITLKNAPMNIPEALQAERRRCSEKLLYQKIHREYVRRQMAESNIEKYENIYDQLGLDDLHSIVSKLFTTKEIQVPPKLVAVIKEGDKEAISTEKVHRATLISNVCGVLKDTLDSVNIRQKLEFIADHPMLNESLKVSDVLNGHQRGKDMLGCFTSFLGLLSLPDKKILGGPHPMTFLNSVKHRRDAIYYYAIKNSALDKNHIQRIPARILQKDEAIYEILTRTFVTADIKRVLCCSDNISAYLYLAIIINDIPGISIEGVSERLFDACEITEERIDFFASLNFAKDLEAKIESLMNNELDDMIKNISARVNANGIPRISHHHLSTPQPKILQLKILLIEIVATFWNPHKLLMGVGVALECRSKIEKSINELGKLLLTGFFHMGKNTIAVEELKNMICDEMNNMQGNEFQDYENSSLLGFVKYIQEHFELESVVSAIITTLYLFTITDPNQFYAHRISLAVRIARKPFLLKIFGLKNSQLVSMGTVNEGEQMTELEKLFEDDYIMHAAPMDPEIFYNYLNQPFNLQYKNLLFALETNCRMIKQRFQFHVRQQRYRLHHNDFKINLIPDDPLICNHKKMVVPRRCIEVPESYRYFPCDI